MMWNWAHGKLNFNSHTREGVTDEQAAVIEELKISTHTPVRVWHIWENLTVDYANFNSHTREGVTNRRKSLYQISRFQLTHPWGCDTVSEAQLRQAFLFQLTHPWGCDNFVYRIIFKRQISTHTPVRVWQNFEEGATYGGISTHTPVRVWHF